MRTGKGLLFPWAEESFPQSKEARHHPIPDQGKGMKKNDTTRYIEKIW